MSLPVTTAAGALVSAAVFLLTVTGALHYLTTHIPPSIIQGIQLGAGLRLISSGAALILPLAWINPPVDNRTTAAIAFLLLLLTQRARRFPYALLLFTLGLATSFVSSPAGPTEPIHVWHPRLALPDFAAPAAWSAALSQLPLTTLNSILAVTPLSQSVSTKTV